MHLHFLQEQHIDQHDQLNNRHTIIAAFLEKHTYHRVGSPRGRVFQTTKEEQKDSAESFRTRKAVLQNPARLLFIMHTTTLRL